MEKECRKGKKNRRGMQKYGRFAARFPNNIFIELKKMNAAEEKVAGFVFLLLFVTFACMPIGREQRQRVPFCLARLFRKDYFLTL